MDRETILALLGSHREDLKEAGVCSVSLFGSYARGEETGTSDIDLLVEFDAPVSLFTLLKIKERIEGWLGKPVDLVPKDGVKRQLRRRIFAEAIRAA